MRGEEKTGHAGERCNSILLTKDDMSQNWAEAAGPQTDRANSADGIFSQAGNYLPRHQAQSQPRLDWPLSQEAARRIIVFDERRRHARPACPCAAARIRIFAIHPPEQPQIMDPNPAALDETIGLRDQLIGQHRSCIRIAVASAARLIAKNMVQLGPLRIDVAAVQAIDRDRRVDQDTAADGVDSEAEIKVRSGPQILQRRIVGKQVKRIAAKAIARCRRPDPLIGQAHKPNCVEHAPVEIFRRPSLAERMLVGRATARGLMPRPVSMTRLKACSVPRTT